mmetsp:Transcript_12460/g.29357  ORF Transcript_12460/g.29357 Transcript_12460/m.29357 type:complete len:209 (-) Transcript_12460:12-638(-)
MSLTRLVSSLHNIIFDGLQSPCPKTMAGHSSSKRFFALSISASILSRLGTPGGMRSGCFATPSIILSMVLHSIGLPSHSAGHGSWCNCASARAEFLSSPQLSECISRSSRIRPGKYSVTKPLQLECRTRGPIPAPHASLSTAPSASGSMRKKTMSEYLFRTIGCCLSSYAQTKLAKPVVNGLKPTPSNSSLLLLPSASMSSASSPSLS